MSYTHFKYYFAMFFSLFALHAGGIFLTFSFVYWSFNPGIWSADGRFTFALFLLLNFGISVPMSMNFASKYKGL